MGRKTEILFCHIDILFSPDNNVTWKELLMFMKVKKSRVICHTPTLQTVLLTGITFSVFFSATVMKNR